MARPLFQGLARSLSGIGGVGATCRQAAERPDVARKRDRWKRHHPSHDPRRLAFIGET